MDLDDFDYDLPPERIAQHPCVPRDAARLLVHRRAGRTTDHRRVRDLPELLEPGDLLVVNDTRVRPARLVGRRPTGARVELLVFGPEESRVDAIGPRDGPGGRPRWRALVKPAARVKAGEELEVADGALVGRLHERVVGAEGPTATWVVELFDPRDPERGVEELLERFGRMPLPPYIRRSETEELEGDGDRDRSDYQTVFARETGAVAAPTAGLHFTPDLLAALDARGVELATVTLHVGLGTFQPVKVTRVEDHEMHAERYELRAETVEAVERCRDRGGRVVAVGTTSVRVLESCVADGRLRPGAGETRLFVTPGHRFVAVDGMLTNFHLPKSTLLLLVSAFAGREPTLALYAEAVERGYRFYSYGDAMLLL